MAYWTELGNSTRSVEVQWRRMSGVGRIFSRLQATFDAKAKEKSRNADLNGVEVRLVHGSEVLGEGRFGPTPVTERDSEVTVEIPMSREAFAFVNEKMVGDRLDLVAHFSGWIALWTGQAVGPSERLDFEPVGGWQQAWVPIQVPRSDWFSQVLKPVGYGEYLFFELPIPESSWGDDFRKAAGHLEEADKAYVTGNDPGVFAACRAAIDALPGAKQRIYDKVPDPTKRDEINQLALKIGHYLHTGRHVAEGGIQQGEFPVDHRDAEFALHLTRLLVAYTAKLIPSDT